MELISEVIKAWGFAIDDVALHQLGTGLINKTFLLTHNHNKFVLQQINTLVFKQPQIIAQNVKYVGDYLKESAPDYLFINPIVTQQGEAVAIVEDTYWRLTPFVNGAVAFEVLSDTKQAYEAAKQFGKLTRLLAGLDTEPMQDTIPGFHDLALRKRQFDEALDNANEGVKTQAQSLIQAALNHVHILNYYHSFENSKNFPDRVVHHDTKISNVLLNEHTFDGICVIDLDTLMPGKFISDLGDMMRTYLCAFSENEPDLNKINIRVEFYEALVKGYLSEMKPVLTDTEKQLILYSGKFMTYMQALRFLTDFLNGNVYYPISYQNQNLDRAANQFKLLSEFYHHEKVLNGITESCLK